jgi:hypothetical protein
MSNIFANAIDNIEAIKNNDPKEEIVKKVSKAAKGGFTGLVGGLMIAWYYKKNLYVYAMLGTLAGGAVSYFLFDEV